MLKHKNGETRQCANTNRASIENIRVGNIDMNIVAKSDLNFQGKAVVPVSGMTGTWLTSAEIANALQYKSAKSVTNLFNQNSDEFSGGMTQVIESVTSGNYRKKVRVFSLRGAHLIAMFARTPVAKDFRRWVLDILDREAVHSPLQFTAEEMSSLAYMWFWMDEAQKVSKEIRPALQQLKSEYAGFFYDLNNETPHFTNIAKNLLIREMSKMDVEIKPTRRADPKRTLASLKGERSLH